MLKGRRFTPAMIVAMIALGVTLSGSAMAAGLVTSAQIKDGTIRSSTSTRARSRRSRVTAARPVSVVRLAPGATGAAGATGAQGPVGQAGAQGPVGPQGQQGVPGTPAPTMLRLKGDFAGSNASVATTLDGVQFGPYSNGGTAGGSVVFTPVNGLTLADIDQLSYTVKHSSADDNSITSPYLRIFLANGKDVIFDATQCGTVVPAEDVFTPTRSSAMTFATTTTVVMGSRPISRRGRTLLQPMVRKSSAVSK